MEEKGLIMKDIKIKPMNILIIFILFIFAFERAIVTYAPFFGFIDEAFSIICFGIVFVKLLLNKINKTDKLCLLLLCIVLIIGLISNANSSLISSFTGIITDILSIFKVFIVFILFNNSKLDNEDIIRKSAFISRIIVVIMMICWLISLIFNIGMMDTSIRFGMQSYKFVFNNAGNFSKFFYFLVPLLLVDLKFKDTKYKRFIFFMSLIIWCLTLRTRAFVFVLTTLTSFILFFVMKIKKFNVLYLIPIGLIILLISYEQIEFYFANDTQARSLLLKYSFVTMKNYFPFGSGFGTYGSDVAIQYYSPLYVDYGFMNVWGMGLEHTSFLNDNYWPMIIGQFGLFGLICIILVIYLITKETLINSKKDRYYLVSSLLISFFLLMSSIASKSYSEYSSICIFMLLAIQKVKNEKVYI